MSTEEIMTTLPERLKELASRMNQDGDKYDAFTLLAEAVQALQAQEVGRITQGDVVAIACELARIDGYDPKDERGGLYDLRWSGGPEPEPEGDAWHMDYLPKGERIAKALGFSATPTINTAAPSPTAALQAGET